MDMISQSGSGVLWTSPGSEVPEGCAVDFGLPGSCETFVVTRPKSGLSAKREVIREKRRDGSVKQTQESHQHTPFPPPPQRAFCQKPENGSSNQASRAPDQPKSKGSLWTFLKSCGKSTRQTKPEEATAPTQPVSSESQRKETPVQLFFGSSDFKEKEADISEEKSEEKITPAQKSQKKSKTSLLSFFKRNKPRKYEAAKAPTQLDTSVSLSSLTLTPAYLFSGSSRTSDSSFGRIWSRIRHWVSKPFHCVDLSIFRILILFAICGALAWIIAMCL